MSNNLQKENGTGMTPPINSSASGAVTSAEATRKHPKQGIKPRMKIDINSHGIRRETSMDPKPPRKPKYRKPE